MKRRAILLGHVDGDLHTNADLNKMYDFLCSNRGGAWCDTEIIRQANIPRLELDRLLYEIREEELDFTLFYFSGHGEYVRGTSLELNPSGDEINERELACLGVRQINIFDCCRKLPEKPLMKNANFGSLEGVCEAYDRKRLLCRQLYNNRIMSASPQQMSLYACSIDEYAHDFSNGGIYTNYLLSAAKSLNGDYVLASSAHAKASVLTAAEALLRGVEQTPDYYMAKLPSRLQLVLAVNDGIVK